MRYVSLRFSYFLTCVMCLYSWRCWS